MSKKLAIKGHPTRGNEVIEILKMMGGEAIRAKGNDETAIYVISVNGILEQKAMKIFILDKFGYVGNVAKLKRLNYNKVFVENLSIYTDILLI